MRKMSYDGRAQQLFVEGDTYEIKEQLKKLGFKFTRALDNASLWSKSVSPEEFPLVSIELMKLGVKL